MFRPVDVSGEAIKGICEASERGVLETHVERACKSLDQPQRQRLFAGEVVEERSLRHARRRADLVDARGSEALGHHEPLSGLEELLTTASRTNQLVHTDQMVCQRCRPVK